MIYLSSKMSQNVTISRKQCYEAYKKLKEKDPSVIGDFDTAEKIINLSHFVVKDLPHPKDPTYRQYVQQKGKLKHEMQTVMINKRKKGEAKLTGIFFDSSKFKELTYLQNNITSGTGDL